MKILKLTAENIKKLVAVEICPDGNLVQITGKNGQGKTSVLDSIWWALGGLASVQERPIREGEDKAVIKLDLGEVVVTRLFKKSKESEEGFVSSISVESSDGVKFSSPQALLDGLVGSLSFDPLAFSRMDDKGRYEELKKFVTEVDIEALAEENKRDFELRTVQTRKAKEFKALAEGLKVPANAPKEPVDEKEITKKLAEASEKNLAHERAVVRQEQIKRKLESLASEEAARKEEIQKLVGRISEIHQGIIACEEEQKTIVIPESVDVASLKKEADGVHDLNVAYEMFRKKQEALEQSLQHEKNSLLLTQTIDARNAARRKAIADSKMPIENLTIGDEAGTVLLNGLPFSQASDAEQLRASIAIAMASNPRLRIIRVRDGSLLDEDSLKLLEDMANSADYQVWIERVDGSGKVGVVIENGMVKA